jgi:hypothetical protein
MRKGISNKVITILSVATFLSLFAMVSMAEALDPKLLWEKEFEPKRFHIELAVTSGDVLISAQREVIVYDKEGNEKAHWGPRIDRTIYGSSISADGKYFSFSSGLTEKAAMEKEVPSYSDDRIHLFDNKGREIWSMGSFGSPTISPDGTYIIADYEAGFIIYDMDANKLFSHEEDRPGITATSPDGLYFLIKLDLGDPSIKLYSKDGTKVWERKYTMAATSISKGAEYFATYPYVDVINPANSSNGFLFNRSGKRGQDKGNIASREGSSKNNKH